MSAKTYHLTIITQESIFFEGEVVSMRAPAELGSLGVLPNHAPLVTTCVSGPLHFRTPDGKESQYQVEEGFLEVLKNNVTLFTREIQELENNNA